MFIIIQFFLLLLLSFFVLVGGWQPFVCLVEIWRWQEPFEGRLRHSFWWTWRLLVIRLDREFAFQGCCCCCLISIWPFPHLFPSLYHYDDGQFFLAIILKMNVTRKDAFNLYTSCQSWRMLLEPGYPNKIIILQLETSLAHLFRLIKCCSGTSLVTLSWNTPSTRNFLIYTWRIIIDGTFLLLLPPLLLLSLRFPSLKTKYINFHRWCPPIFLSLSPATEHGE